MRHLLQTWQSLPQSTSGYTSQWLSKDRFLALHSADFDAPRPRPLPTPDSDVIFHAFCSSGRQQKCCFWLLYPGAIKYTGVLCPARVGPALGQCKIRIPKKRSSFIMNKGVAPLKDHCFKNNTFSTSLMRHVIVIIKFYNKTFFFVIRNHYFW